jgi:monoterpene epsilon-lactone hydrolase
MRTSPNRVPRHGRWWGLVERACSFGVDARLAIYPVATHMFQHFWSFLLEAADALDHAGAFISRVSD